MEKGNKNDDLQVKVQKGFPCCKNSPILRCRVNRLDVARHPCVVFMYKGDFCSCLYGRSVNAPVLLILDNSSLACK